MTLQEAFAIAKKKARYGHRDWIVFKSRDGSGEAHPYSAAALKAAMLATGTQGRFSLIGASSAVPYSYTWRLACLSLRNARFLSGEAR